MFLGSATVVAVPVDLAYGCVDEQRGHVARRMGASPVRLTSRPDLSHSMAEESHWLAR